MSQRTRRVDELLREEIGAILAKEIADPAIGFATITEVETAPDLRHARVWVSVIGSRAEREATLRALDRAMAYVRRELGRRLRLRRIPELQVRLDDSAERGTRVLRLLADLDEGRTPDEAPADESLPTPVARIGHGGEAPAAEEPPQPGSARAAGTARRRGRPSGAVRPRANERRPR